MTEPSLLGRYEVLAELGNGAMGAVYPAHDPMLNRMVAIKTINTEEARHERMAEHEAPLYTQTVVILGAPKYISPEQVVGKGADHRSGILSLGVILYECITGSTPFNGEGLSALMYQITNHDPSPPSASNSQVPVMLDYIVAKVLAKSPEARYQSAADFANDLRECKAQILTGQPGVGVGQIT